MESPTAITDRRIAAIGGIAFVVLWPLMVLMSGLDFMDDPGDYVQQVTDDAGPITWATWLGMLASVGLVLFGAGLAHRLWSAGQRYLSGVAAIGTAVGAAVAVAGQSAILVAGIRGGDEGTTEPIATTLIDLGIGSMIDGAPKGFALVALAAALDALRRERAGFGAISLIVAAVLAMPLGISFYATFVFLAWVLSISVGALARNADHDTTINVTASTPAATA